MLESYLNSPVTRRRLRSGLAADHIDAFADWLHVQGYRPTCINNLLRSLAGWTDWMLAAGFTAQDLLAGFEACKLALEQKQRGRYSRGPNHYSVTAASVFIRFLQHQGELPLPATASRGSELWPLLGEFRCWMREHRGLTDTTLDAYEGILTGLLDALGSGFVQSIFSPPPRRPPFECFPSVSRCDAEVKILCILRCSAKR